MRGPELYTGFEQGKLIADSFLYAATNKVLQSFGKLRLIKLHGSTSWLRRKDTGEIVEKEYDKDQADNEIGVGLTYNEEVVIYPLSQKQLYVDPYVQMFYCLNKELEGRKVCIVIGYSFRDPVIQNIFVNILIKMKTNMQNISELVKNILDGNVYVKVASVDFPLGEMGGKVVLTS